MIFKHLFLTLSIQSIINITNFNDSIKLNYIFLFLFLFYYFARILKTLAKHSTDFDEDGNELPKDTNEDTKDNVDKKEKGKIHFSNN